MKLIILFGLLLSIRTLGGAPLLEVKYLNESLEVKYFSNHPQIEQIDFAVCKQNPLIRDTKKQIILNEKWAVKLDGKNPKLLETSWDHLKKNPLELFMECVDPGCELCRKKDPKPRGLFEEKVLKAALDKQDDSLHVAFFGSAYLYDTLVHVSQILQRKPQLKALKIDLVDKLYAEYISDLRKLNQTQLDFLKFDNLEKQNWFNFLTLRFALFSTILQKIAPQTSITLHISTKLQAEGGNPDLIVGGDFAEPGECGFISFHDVLTHGASVMNEGGMMLLLGRTEDPPPYQIWSLKKLTSAEASRSALAGLSPQKDKLATIEKRMDTVLLQKHFHMIKEQ